MENSGLNPKSELEVKRDILFCIRTPTSFYARTDMPSHLPRRLFLTSLGLGVVESSIQLDETQTQQRSQGANGVVDVPNWRIGDEWVYETRFDVAQLLAQANVSASLNTLTGDTDYEIEDIFFISVDGIQTLAYKMKIEGEFSSGNSGATLEGVSGRLTIDYTGEDIIRVRDLAVINSEFELDVNFAPLNLGFLSQNLATISFDTYYNPPKEKYDFPMRTGDQWYMPFMSGTSVSGSRIILIQLNLTPTALKTLRGKSQQKAFQRG